MCAVLRQQPSVVGGVYRQGSAIKCFLRGRSLELQRLGFSSEWLRWVSQDVQYSGRASRNRGIRGTGFSTSELRRASRGGVRLLARHGPGRALLSRGGARCQSRGISFQGPGQELMSSHGAHKGAQGITGVHRFSLHCLEALQDVEYHGPASAEGQRLRLVSQCFRNFSAFSNTAHKRHGGVQQHMEKKALSSLILDVPLGLQLPIILSSRSTSASKALQRTRRQHNHVL